MNRSFNRLKAVVQLIFPQFSEEQAYQFVEYENSYAMTLYPASLEYKEFHHISGRQIPETRRILFMVWAKILLI